MKVLPLVLATALLCLCGCKKKTDENAAASPSSSTPTADASQPAAPAAAPGVPATAPYNPGLKLPPPGPPVTINGVTINVQNAEKALATASWDANVSLADLRTALRYQDYRRALGSLQKAASDPSVNDAQRSVLQQVMEEVKQASGGQVR